MWIVFVVKDLKDFKHNKHSLGTGVQMYICAFFTYICMVRF